MNEGRRRGLIGLLFRWAGGLRFPWLLGLTALLFLIDLLVPDLVPFADEILLGMATLGLAAWRRRRERRPVGVERDARDRDAIRPPGGAR